MESKKLARGGMAVALILCLGTLGFAAYKLILRCAPCRIAVVVLAGRGGGCTLRQTLAAHRLEQLRLASSPKHRRLVREEPDGCLLWELDGFHFWTPQEGTWSGKPAFTRYRNLDATGELLVRPGDVVLDGGAHVGDSAVEALELGAKLVVSIEPSPRNLTCLRRNLEKEMAEGRAIVVPKGVWDHEGTLVFAEVPGNSGADHFTDAHQGSPKDRTVGVPVTTIDKLVEDLKLDRVDLIKLDIEGSEQRALIGAKKTLARYKPRLAVASYHLANDLEAIPSLVKNAWPGYQVQCARCVLAGWRVRPQMLYFH